MDIFRPGGLELTEKAAVSMALGRGARLLDVGCGLGTSLDFLAERFGVEPHGVDASVEAVLRAGRPYILHGRAEALPFPDGSFDAVLMECVLPLFDRPEKALDEAGRVLKKGGGLAVGALSGRGLGALTEAGRADFGAVVAYLEAQGFTLTLLSDESAALRQFIGEVIFRYGSIEQYVSAAEASLGGGVLDCRTPRRGTGYALLTARKD